MACGDVDTQAPTPLGDYIDKIQFQSSKSRDIEKEVMKSLPCGSIILRDKLPGNENLSAVGMFNIRNNCYMNASLQVILRTGIGSILRSLAHDCCKLEFCLVNYLKSIIKHLSNGVRINNTSLVKNIRAINRNFREGQQEDAHEMILSLLEYLRKDIKGTDKRADNMAIQFLDTTMCTKFKQMIDCKRCGNRSTTSASDPFVILDCSSNLIDGLRSHFAPEVLTGDCAYHCDKCNARVTAVKRLAIDCPGSYFGIQLSRFSYGGSGKNNRHLYFPPTLDLSPFFEKSNFESHKYRLHSVIVHEGDSCRSGHYYSIVKHGDYNYMEYNDSEVSQIRIEEVLRTRPYVLMYARNIKTPNPLKRKLSATSINNEPRKAMAPKTTPTSSGNSQAGDNSSAVNETSRKFPQTQTFQKSHWDYPKIRLNQNHPNNRGDNQENALSNGMKSSSKSYCGLVSSNKQPMQFRGSKSETSLFNKEPVDKSSLNRFAQSDNQKPPLFNHRFGRSWSHSGTNTSRDKQRLCLNDNRQQVRMNGSGSAGGQFYSGRVHAFDNQRSHVQRFEIRDRGNFIGNKSHDYVNNRKSHGNFGFNRQHFSGEKPRGSFVVNRSHGHDVKRSQESSLSGRHQGLLPVAKSHNHIVIGKLSQATVQRLDRQGYGVYYDRQSSGYQSTNSFHRQNNYGWSCAKKRKLS